MTQAVENHLRWITEAKRLGATHVIDVCDTFDYDNYPVYVMPGEDIDDKVKEYSNINMQKVECVIDMDTVCTKSN